MKDIDPIRKAFTILVVSNARGATKKLVIDAAWLKAGLLFFVLIAVLGSVSLVDYIGLLVQSVENKRLKTENIQLKAQFQIIEGKVSALENSLERVKNFAQRLKLITNIDNEDRTTQLVLGGSEMPGKSISELDTPIDKRGLASEIEERDAPFFESPFLNEVGGEIDVRETRDYATLSVRIDQVVRETQLREQSILDLRDTLMERQSLLNATPSIRPVRGWFTSRFGYRISPFTGRPVMHNGIDIAASPGSPVFSPADGVISFAGYDPGYGQLVSIDHGYGVVTRFGHNSRVFVTVGQKIRRWDVVAAVGNTGRSTGPHLHYEVRVNGIPIDPSNYILEF